VLEQRLARRGAVELAELNDWLTAHGDAVGLGWVAAALVDAAVLGRRAAQRSGARVFATALPPLAIAITTATTATRAIAPPPANRIRSARAARAAAARSAARRS